MGQARLIRAVALIVLAWSQLMGADPAAARQTMSFVPGGRGRLAVHSGYHGQRYARHRATYGHQARRGGRVRQATPHGGEDGGDTAKAVPGAGFTMQDGVLTYPAPARFQPKNLKHL